MSWMGLATKITVPDSRFECDCESNKKFTDDDIQGVCFGFMDGEKDIQNSGMFDNKDDFTFVVQPFFNGITDPPYSVNNCVQVRSTEHVHSRILESST